MADANLKFASPRRAKRSGMEINMNYAWEAALMADRMGIPREKVRYIPAGDGSPYTEIVQEDINGIPFGETGVGINPLYRFGMIFADICSLNHMEFEQGREMLFQLDLRQGMDRQEYAARFLLQDILQGMYGKDAAETVGLFEKNKLRGLLHMILGVYECGSCTELFRRAMRYLYPDSIVYESNDQAGQILVYVGVGETEEEAGKIRFLAAVFLPLACSVRLFWEHHFGVLDVDETMTVGHMVLF